MARWKLVGDKAGGLSGDQIVKDLLHHKKEFESYIGWPISSADFIVHLFSFFKKS